jgi:hypothetical protein
MFEERLNGHQHEPRIQHQLYHPGEIEMVSILVDHAIIASKLKLSSRQLLLGTTMCSWHL